MQGGWKTSCLPDKKDYVDLSPDLFSQYATYNQVPVSQVKEIISHGAAAELAIGGIAA